jgi:DNA-binding response OmpR family regulator
MTPNRILLLEDDPSFGYILSEYLGMQHLTVDWAKSAEEALAWLAEKPYELALLDIMLPGMSGFELAQRLRQRHPALPFIFLSAKSLKVDQLKGYQLGAYDYVTKPVDEELLLAKIRALLTQTSPGHGPGGPYQIGRYHFAPAQFQLRYEEEVTRLTARETELLCLLCAHAQQLMPRQKALEQIWGSTDEFSRKSMDVFISRLRKYLAKDPRVRIDNVHGKGFILQA